MLYLNINNNYLDYNYYSWPGTDSEAYVNSRNSPQIPRENSPSNSIYLILSRLLAIMASRESSFISELASSSRLPSSEASEQPPLKRKRMGPRHPLWKLFRTANPEKDEVQEDKWGNTMYYCLHCTTWAGSGIVENAKRHMISKHPHIRLPDKEPDNLTIRTNQQIETFFAKAKNKASIHHTRHLTRQVILEALIQLIIICNLSFAIIKEPAFLAFCCCLNPEAVQFIPRSPNTIPRLLGSSLSYYQISVQQKLQETQSLIHLSIDIWTSPNRRSYLAIIAHWVYNWQRQQALLRLPRLIGSHSGETQAKYIFNVLSEYSIAKRLGYITSDNASSNGTLVIRLSETLYSQIKARWDPIRYRIRCTGHIINLSLQAFLFASNKTAWREAIQAAFNNADPDLTVTLIQMKKRDIGKKKAKGKQDSEVEAAGWREVGPLGYYMPRLRHLKLVTNYNRQIA